MSVLPFRLRINILGVLSYTAKVHFSTIIAGAWLLVFNNTLKILQNSDKTEWKTCHEEKEYQLVSDKPIINSIDVLNV